MTIRQKTSLLFTGITATFLVGVSCIAYFFMNTFAFTDFYKRLEIRSVITAKAQLEHPEGQLNKVFSAIRQEHLEPLPSEKEFFFPADSLPAFVQSKTLEELPASFYNAIRPDKTATLRIGDIFYTGINYEARGQNYIIILGAKNEGSILYAHKLKLVLIICCIVGTLVAYSAGIFFSRQTFKPIREIINKVKTIGAENLHLRLATNQNNDEIAEVNSTFNEMLSRLETAFETQNNFVSNASHELRTPLTAIYGEAEIALSRDRSGNEYKRSLGIIVTQAEKLQRLTNSLLSLAQTGFDGKRQHFSVIPIDELLTDVKNTINTIIPDNKIQFHFLYLPAGEHDMVVTGNYQLLKLGLNNVLENACKYSKNDAVSVNLEKENNMLCISVHDSGIGIPAEELKHIYDPFFRASNTGKFEGYGIGLPLTRNIFKLHKGGIYVQSAVNKGTIVKLTLPLGAAV